MPTRLLTAADIAAAVGLDEKVFRARMRAARFPWHRHGEPWTVEEGGDRHRQMLAAVSAPAPSQASPVASGPRGRTGSDESYVIDICDRLLGSAALRQHMFDWLVGDGPSPRRLPVDAYYRDFQLVVEVLERQHSEAIKHFDKPDRMTVSGVHRGEQRTLYDQRRRDLLPRHGLTLVEIRIDELAHDKKKKLLRIADQDEAVIREKLRVAGLW